MSQILVPLGVAWRAFWREFRRQRLGLVGHFPIPSTLDGPADTCFYCGSTGPELLKRCPGPS